MIFQPWIINFCHFRSVFQPKCNLLRILLLALQLGADIVVHSGTKFLGGHNDVLAGFVCVKGKELSEKLRYTYKTVGCSLSPFDSFLVLRGIKTLSVRLERQQENAKKIALWLKNRPEVTEVYYPGLEDHPGYEVNKNQ